MVFIVVVVIKSLNLWAHYKVTWRRNKSQFWAIKRVISKSLGNGWVWFDIVIIVALSGLVILYVLYAAAHEELFEDFDFDFQSGFTNAPDESVLVSEIYSACFDSITNVTV